jgi:hypothetical protein
MSISMRSIRKRGPLQPIKTIILRVTVISSCIELIADASRREMCRHLSSKIEVKSAESARAADGVLL